MKQILLLFGIFLWSLNISSQSSEMVIKYAAMRKLENYSSEIIRYVSAGEYVKIISKGNAGYYKVDYQGVTGYIHETFFYKSSDDMPFKSENEYKEYFKKNIQTLDPIEGIWSVNFTSYKYVNDELAGTKTEQNVSSWAVIKEGANFSSYNLNNSTSPIVVSFSKTAIDNIYIYSKLFIDSKRKYYANATITDNALMEYTVENTYEDNLEYFKIISNEISKDYKGNLSESEKYEVIEEMARKTRIYYNYKWIKIYPANSEIEKSNSSTGTGFAITSNGLIATCNHVIDGAKTIKVKGIGGDFNKSYSAKVISKDANNDLALIKIEDETFTTLGTISYIIKSTTIDVGSDIYILGYPLTATMGDEIKLTNGIVSSKSGFKGDITSYQLTAAAQPGNSGGPLFDKNGNLIGVINAKHVEAESATYAVKSTYLINLIESLPTTPNLQTINKLTGKALSEQVKLIKNFVYIIEIN